MSEEAVKDDKKEGLFSTFFDAATALLAKRRKDRQVVQALGKLATQERIQELAVLVQLGHDAAQHLDSLFWTKHAEPYLRSIAVLKPFVPRSASPATDAIAFQEYLVGSGRATVISLYRNQLEQWVADGEEAQRELDREAERRRLAAASGGRP